MVVWVYAGGGEAEAFGVIPFLQRNLNCTFTRRTPKTKPGPKPVAGSSFYGHTGRDFTREIREDISNYWDGTTQTVLVLDDTDGEPPAKRAKILKSAVQEALAAKGIAITASNPNIIVALAVPELEVWLLADWDNTFKKEFSNCHAAVQHELATNKQVNFAAPEDFTVRDQQGYHKLSEILKDAIQLKCVVTPKYSKATDTPRLLQLIDPSIVSRKCPHFRSFWTKLVTICS